MSIEDYYTEYKTIRKKIKMEFWLVIHNSLEWPMTLLVFLTVDCTWEAGSDIQNGFLGQEMKINRLMFGVYMRHL